MNVDLVFPTEHYAKFFDSLTHVCEHYSPDGAMMLMTTGMLAMVHAVGACVLSAEKASSLDELVNTLRAEGRMLVANVEQLDRIHAANFFKTEEPLQ